MREAFYVIKFLIPLLIILVITISIKKNKTNKINMKKINIYREIPCNKDIYIAYSIAKIHGLTDDDKYFIGSIYLKLIFDGNIEIKKENNKTLLILKNEPNDKISKELYLMMMEASKDGILESNEFEQYSKNNSDKILMCLYDAIEYGGKSFKSSELNTPSSVIDSKVNDELIKLAGFKKYLEEFSSMKEKDAIDVKLWKEYLMFAQIFGMSDKIAEQFEELYPEIFTEMNSLNIYFNEIKLINYYSKTISNSIKYNQNYSDEKTNKNYEYKSGGKNHSSHGGGKGSFGGGGGGTR